MISNFRKTATFSALAILFVLITGPVLKAANADAIIGEWYTENNKSVVKIYKQGGKYFGKIIWLKVPNDKNGYPKKDKNNPDKNKFVLVGLTYWAFKIK